MENQYKWLIVVEGTTDVEVYREILSDADVKEFRLFPAVGKNRVYNSNAWHSIKDKNNISLLDTIKNDLGRSNFKGLLLIVDSDDNIKKPFNQYTRTDNELDYELENKPDNKTTNVEYSKLDSLNGVNTVPILGINVPSRKSGCLETELLDAYGFPVEGQPEYENLKSIIKETSQKWKIPKKKNGKDWWDENEKAKIDKFIYSALRHGFKVSTKLPKLERPDVVRRIKLAIQAMDNNSSLETIDT